jgi:phage-related protein (TIGR01555 family)
MYHDIFDYRTAFGNTAGILGEFVVGKYKFADLDDILASGNEKKLQSRMAGIEMSKSLINAVMLGTDEEYSRDSASVSGLSDLLDRFMMTVAAATGYPVTKLFGRSASGLNATGEGDQKAYYDMLRAEMVDLQPEIQYLIDIFVAYLGLPEGDYTFKFGNLYQPTAHEEADLERVKAETLRTSMDAAQRAIADGVLAPEQVYNLYYKKLLQDEPWQEPEPDDSAMEGVDNEAIISGQPVPPQETDDSESKNDELEEAISLEIPLESREGIIKRIAKALFGNSK